MKCLIVEDEPLSAEHLARLLLRADASAEVLDIADSVVACIGKLSSGMQPDLIFLDIHLADGLSFDIFSSVKVETPVIFTTAYSEYAIRAFEVNSVDYLLKPIGINELRAAIAKFRKYHQVLTGSFMERIAAAYRQPGNLYKTRFMVKTGQLIETIPTADILHFTTSEGLTFLTIENGKRYPVDYTLEQVEAMLSPADFFRINRKCIIGMKAIRKISPYFNSRLTLTSAFLEGETAVVSRERVADFKLWLDS
jgi:DNA-binding LytR/AlgR family response regulator